jgi:hypothetical protein
MVVQVWRTSDFLEGSVLVADAPHWFSKESEIERRLPNLKEEYEQLRSDDLLVVCCDCDGTVTIQNVGIWNQLLSDEAVESIGREDYVRMVGCLGQPIADRYFEKKSGLV